MCMFLCCLSFGAVSRLLGQLWRCWRQGTSFALRHRQERSDVPRVADILALCTLLAALCCSLHRQGGWGWHFPHLAAMASSVSMPSRVLWAGGEGTVDAASLPTDTVVTTTTADSTTGVATGWAAGDNPAGGVGRARSDSLNWVTVETAHYSAPWRAASA